MPQVAEATGKGYAIFVEIGGTFERMSAVCPATPGNLARLRESIRGGERLSQIPPDSKDIICGDSAGLRSRSIATAEFRRLVTEGAFAVVEE